MAYRASPSWLMIALALCLLSASAQAGSTYSAGGRLFNVADLKPAASPRYITHIVAATPDVLTRNLRGMGWRERSLECAADLPPQRLGDRLPDLVFESLERGAHGMQQALFWREADSNAIRGLPTWVAWVGGTPLVTPVTPVASVLLCEDPRSRLSGDLMAGIWQLHWATPHTPGMSSLPWIVLHLAADALERLVQPPAGAVSVQPPPECRAPGPLPTPLPLRNTYPLVWNESTAAPYMALTFDACSTLDHGDYNPAVIEALVANHIPATLFIGGRWAEMHPRELRYLASLPQFELGNHTFTHPHMRQLAAWQQRQELLWTQEVIFSLTGQTPRFFRPPYGEIDDALVREAARLGLYTVEYDLPSGDATVDVPSARLTAWILAKARPGTVVIMHMNRPGNKTAEALPDIARGLRQKGLVLGTISDLIARRYATNDRADLSASNERSVDRRHD